MKGFKRIISKKEIKAIIQKGKNFLLNDKFPFFNATINEINWGIIRGWWSKLRDYVKESLSNGYREVVIIDPRYEGGLELLKLCGKRFSNNFSFEDFKGLLVVKVNQDGSVGEVDNLIAEPQVEDQYDAISKDKDGVIRIK